jgi:hypothetical protein
MKTPLPMLDPREMICEKVNVSHRSTITWIISHMDLAGRKGTVELAIPILFSLPYITIRWFKDVGFFLCYLLLGRARMGTDFRISHFEFGFLLYVNRFGERYAKRRE